MSPLYFLPNSLSDSSFESYLQDTGRYRDYCNVKNELLPNLLASLEHFRHGVDSRFVCSNRFEDQHPALRIQSPSGFVPDLIYIEFPIEDELFCVKQAGQIFKVSGLENLAHHLRVLLVMGLAHWHPR
jgi:hypothetical protein